MKYTLIALIVLALVVSLWYLSGVLFIFGIGFVGGHFLGIINGYLLNDWFETTRLHQWRKRRQQDKANKVAPATSVA